MKHSIILILTTILLASCGSDSGSSGTGKVSGTFSDNAVTSFTQTGGLAKAHQERLRELIIPSAYAASGTYSCISGDTAVFDATVFSTNYVLQVVCNSNMETKIRAALLETMELKKMLIEVSEQGKSRSPITLPVVSSNSMSVFLENTKVYLGSCSNTAIKKGPLCTGGDTWTPSAGYDSSVNNCFSQVVFDLSKGTVIERVSAGTTGLAGQAGSQNVNCSSGGTDYTSGFTADRHFRFKDGKLEFDFNTSPTFLSGTVNGNGVPTNTDYERWCIDDNEDGTCDAI